MLKLGAADAVYASLVTGGLPLISDEWTRGLSLSEYLDDGLDGARYLARQGLPHEPIAPTMEED